MGILEKAKEFGQKRRELSPRQRFKEEIGAYAQQIGNEPDAARKLFLNRTGAYKQELSSKGVLDAKSENFNNFDVALTEMFGADKIKYFSDLTVSVDTNGNHFLRPLADPVLSDQQKKDAAEYYKNKFKQYEISQNEIDIRAQGVAKVRAYLDRFLTDPRISNLNGQELGDVLYDWANTDLAADLGQALREQEVLLLFDTKVEKLGKALERMQSAITDFKSIRDPGAKLLWGNAVDFFSGLKYESMPAHVGSLLKFAAKEVRDTLLIVGKTVKSGVKMAGSLIETAQKK